MKYKMIILLGEIWKPFPFILMIISQNVVFQLSDARNEKKGLIKERWKVFGTILWLLEGYRGKDHEKEEQRIMDSPVSTPRPYSFCFVSPALWPILY